MKGIYLDIMEKSLSAYTDRRIRDYIDEVKQDGLTEHGFPRLAANIGILIAHGRRTELTDTFIEIMDICCDQIPKRKAANDFSIREVCYCLMLMEDKQAIEQRLIDKWRIQLTNFDPWSFYNVVDDHSGRFVGNWALFATVSEYVRGVFCRTDTSEFVEWQLPCQLANIDEMGMYQDRCLGGNGNPVTYDIVPRFLFATLLSAGYRGKYQKEIEALLDKSADITLKMQSVTGEIAFGGRSNQFLHNEPLLTSYCEMEAVRFAKKGDIKKAAQFKSAARLAAKNTLKYLSLDPISHIKNRYDVSTKIGCERYGYFNKYMITVASNIYLALKFGDDKITPSVAPAEKGGYAVRTGEGFHKTFLNAGGYFAQIDTNADFHYDANGLGRVHKIGCPSAICLSVPFSPNPSYTLEGQNPSAMSICCYAEKDGERFIGAEEYAQHTFISSESSEHYAQAVFDVKLPQDITLTHTYALSEKGVDITLSGYDDIGFMLPVFEFDGKAYTNITISDKSVSVEYGGAVCIYSFEGALSSDYAVYYNRNGRYRVYEASGHSLHIEITEKE